MKNKEIEELLNELKDEDNYIEEYDFRYKRIALDDWQLLLSHIEQLEKRNKELYEGFMATHEELTDYATKNEQLENNRDKAIEYVEEKGRLKYNPNELIKILKGDSE